MAHGFLEPCVFAHHYTNFVKSNEPIIPLVHVCNEIDTKSSKRVVESLRTIRRNIEAGRNIPHVVLRVASPGGEIFATQKITDELDKLPVPYTISLGNAAASGGYWIAAGADRIFSNEMTLTGSIGCYMVRWDVSTAFEKLGVNVEVHSTGPYTGMDNVLHPITPDMKKALTKQVDQIYSEFKDHAAKGRGMSIDLVEKVAGGRVYAGHQAMENKLVDQIGGLKEALDYVKQKHGLENTVVEHFPSREVVGWVDVLVHSFVGGVDSPVTNLASLRFSSMQVQGLFRRFSSGGVKDESTAVKMAWKQLCNDDSD